MPPEASLHLTRLLKQHAASWQMAGLTHMPREIPGVADAPPEPMRVAVSAEAAPIPPEIPTPMKSTAASRAGNAKSMFAGESDTSRNRAPAANSALVISRADRLQNLNILNEAVKGCTRCTELATTRTQTVFGVGNPEAKILFIGEAPGADEDAQGEPFVGRAGQLLNQIIAACKLKREDIYICNILKCRPPGNRTPLPDECGHCREYLDGQLATIAPEYIVCWGTVAAQNLLKTDVTIGKLRKRFFQHGDAKVLCTYHPSYLLRNPAAKKDVWDDMKFLFADMGVDLTQK